jgi:hypothetical protein
MTTRRITISRDGTVRLNGQATRWRVYNPRGTQWWVSDGDRYDYPHGRLAEIRIYLANLAAIGELV